MASPERHQGIPTDKSRLQEYAQRAGVQLPMYQTLNEGPPHARQFKSQVLLDGIWYTSPNTFLCRKMAEHDAAKHAFICFREKLKAEGRSLILEAIHFCKAIMNEYAMKMNMVPPTYVTNEVKASLPIFVSSLLLNGVTFTGDTARTKKEAQQSAAQSAILSILVSEAGTTMSEMLKSKSKFYNAFKLAKNSSSIQAFPVNAKYTSIIPASPVMGSSVVAASAAKDPSIFPASAVNIPASAVNTSACDVRDSPMIPACITTDSCITPACNVEDLSSIPACDDKDPASMQTYIVKDSPNIHLRPVANEVAPVDSAFVSFTSTKEVDVGVSAIKDALATIRQPCFGPFPSLQLEHSESASEQPSCSQSTHQSLHVFKRPKPISSAEAVTPIVFVPPTVEPASESLPVCSTSGKKRRKNKKAKKKVLYQSPSTIAMVPQNQVPVFPVITQQSGPSVSLQGFVAQSQAFCIAPS